MFNPKYIISNRLLDNIKRITEIITELNSHSFSGIVLAKLEKSEAEQSAREKISKVEIEPLLSYMNNIDVSHGTNQHLEPAC